MALVALGGGGQYTDPRYRQLLASQLIGQSIGGFGQVMEQQKQKAALGQLLAGTPAKMDPGVASLDIRKAQGGAPYTPSQPGMLQTGQLTPQMAQAFMLQGGDPKMLAGLMPQPGEGFSLTPGAVRYNAQGQQIASAPAEAAGAQSSIGKVIADFGGDPTNPADLARAAEIMKSTQAGTNIQVKIPAQYPSAPEGMHYEGLGTDNPHLVPTPGFEPEISGPAAAAQALVPGALSEVQQLEEALFPGGEFDRSQALTMNAPIIGGVPNTAGQGLRAAMRAGAMAILRHESGGAITNEEIENKLSTYMPGPLDTPDVARQNFERYKRDLESTYATASRGRGAPPPVPPSQSAPQQPGFADQLLQQGMGAVQGMMGGSAPAQAAPAQAPQGQVGEGTIATNPQTGQNLILRNGQWVPL